MNIKDISIYFSGRNIGKVVNIAIKSFIYWYPAYKDNIIYFDDYSTDDTIELLRDLSINTTTWKYCNTSKIPETDLIARCDWIFTEILLQCKTRFIWFIDGDTVTVSDRAKILLNENKSCVYWDSSIESDTRIKLSKNIDIVNRLIKSNLLNLNMRKVSCKRFHPYCMLIDTTNYNFSDLLNLNSKISKIYDANISDVATDLTLYTLENSLDYVDSSDIFGNSILHIGWFASMINKSELNADLVNLLNIAYKEVFSDKLISNMLTVLGVDSSELENEILNILNGKEPTKPTPNH